MGRLTDRRVIHVQIRPDGADDHLAGVEPHTDLEGHPVRAEDFLCVLLDCLLHPQRRIARSHGVVLVGEGRSKQCHDPVAHDLVDGAFVAVHGFHHPFEDRVQELARLLRIAVGEHLHRALQVGEQHGHLLPLALQRALGREDLLREVLRCVGSGGAKLWRGGRRC